VREAHPQPMNGVLDLVVVAPSHVVRPTCKSSQVVMSVLPPMFRGK
jgi:hypothetical protein